ncbi:hypothetical protein BDZ97DRAFT_137718 [Flammula alnicola]|nr:hypothetical protein BDZ97DRAFT_137718 [Flammula alnicola]
MTIVEIVSFTASEALLADPSLGDAAVEYLKMAEGCQKALRGFQVKDKTKAYLVVTWDSYNSYEKLQKRGDYPSFVESMKENLSGAPVVQHLDFDVDSSNAFGAPVTELATITPKDGHSQEDLDVLLAEFREEASKTKSLTPPIAVGKIKQIPEAYLTALGWDGVEIHADAAVNVKS